MSTDPKLIKQIPCFKNLTDQQVKLIAEIGNSICYPAGYILFKAGDPGECLYLLLDGEVEVLSEKVKGEETTVENIMSAEIVGCSAIVPPFTYLATERTHTDVEVLEIDAKKLREMIVEDPVLGVNLYQAITESLLDRINELRK